MAEYYRLYIPRDLWDRITEVAAALGTCTASQYALNILRYDRSIAKSVPSAPISHVKSPLLMRERDFAEEDRLAEIEKHKKEEEEKINKTRLYDIRNDSVLYKDADPEGFQRLSFFYAFCMDNCNGTHKDQWLLDTLSTEVIAKEDVERLKFRFASVLNGKADDLFEAYYETHKEE